MYTRTAASVTIVIGSMFSNPTGAIAKDFLLTSAFATKRHVFHLPPPNHRLSRKNVAGLGEIPFP